MVGVMSGCLGPLVERVGWTPRAWGRAGVVLAQLYPLVKCLGILLKRGTLYLICNVNNADLRSGKKKQKPYKTWGCLALESGLFPAASCHLAFSGFKSTFCIRPAAAKAHESLEREKVCIGDTSRCANEHTYVSLCVRV